MATYLLVANQTLGGTALVTVVRERAKWEGAAIHIVVPATDPTDQHPAVEGTASEIAQRRLQEALDRLKEVGIPATGEVGVADPMQVIRDALKGNSYSGLIISTLPASMSRTCCSV